MTNEPGSLFEALKIALAASGDRVILANESRALRGSTLLDEVERWAEALAALGVRAGDRVAVQAEKSLELVQLYLATLRLGAVYLPLNSAYQIAEIGYFLDDAQPVLFVCDPADAEAFVDCGVLVGTLSANSTGSLVETVAARHHSAPAHGARGEDLAAIIYTSGTTGRSKGAMITHANLLSNARALISAWGIGPEDVLLHALPLFHIHGLFVALNTLLLAGGTVRLLPGFDSDKVIDGLPGASLFMGVPTYYVRLLANARLNLGAVAGVSLFVCGSAPLTIATFEAFEARTGHRILERYGMSECGIICSNPLNGPRLAGAVGRPLDGIAARIADGKDVGVLEVSGPNVFAGYWRQPEKTRAEFRDDGFFVTGDIATIDDDDVVRIVGRDKDMIIAGGLNVYPVEIEALIDLLPGVDESAVIGLPHPDFGEVVAAVIRPLSGSTPDQTEIIAALRPQLASFKLPKAVFVVTELPRNTMGKVQKALLRAQYSNWFES
ncbi:MAG: AMP-binding protein [Vicinamibacterales bacterium]